MGHAVVNAWVGEQDNDLDDHRWQGHESQNMAFDEFARRQGGAVLALPTGQGRLIK